ncbi:N-acetylmuramoyl-L-alanine amidase [Akkermansia sp.]|uniref:N-acetylmuramoyl-L-alanine amidase n=1 Tax=Akkermansia sp. TaxID=1872421 RepID=UPI003FD86F21
MHCDSSDNVQAHGAHVCFYPGSVKGSRLAMCIAEPLARLLPGRDCTVLARPGLAVLKRTRCPWVLCECGFITNPENAALMKDHPEAIAEAIAEGVKAYSKL